MSSLKWDLLEYLALYRRFVRFLIKDSARFLSGNEGGLLPPLRLMFDGDPNIEQFRKNGEDYLRYFRDLADLKPGERILDVGCGIGRKTIPLTKFLNQNGKYEGFDAKKVHIKWCQKKITRLFPNFRFQHIAVRNKHYNPGGKYSAAELKFPFDDNSFDFVIATSVFTHMLPEEIENYLSEISRVLKIAGRSLVTFFLLNQESLALISESKSSMSFMCEFGVYRTIHRDRHERAAAYDESYIFSLFKRNRLSLKGKVHYGSWPGRLDYLDYQDIIILEKCMTAGI